MQHVSLYGGFSAQHAASARVLLSICFRLAACLCEQSKRRGVSLNKWKKMGVFYIQSPHPLPSPLLFFFAVVWCLLKSRAQLAHGCRNNILILSSKRRLQSSSEGFYRWSRRSCRYIKRLGLQQHRFCSGLTRTSVVLETLISAVYSLYCKNIQQK